MWVADPNSPPSGRAVRGGGAPDHRRPSQRWKAPPRERPSATPTASNTGPQGRKLWGRCWVPRLHRRHPGHTGRATPAARPGGWAAGGGTAPDTRRPSKRWQASPPGDGPPPSPRHAAPTGHAGQGERDGPPQPHTRARSTWVADPNSPPSGRAVGGGGAPDLRRPSERWKAPPRGTPFRHPHCEQRRHARAHTVGPVLGPTPPPTAPGTHGSRNPGRPPQRAGGRGGTAPDTRRPSKRWQATPPGDGPPPSPRHAAPTGHAGQGDRDGPPHPHTRARSTWVADPNSLPSGRAFGGGGAPDLRRPSQRWQATLPGDGPPPPPRHAAPTGHAGQGDRVGPPHPHARAHSTWVVDPNSPPSGRAVGGGGAPEIRRPPQQWKAPPPGTPFRHPHGGRTAPS